MESQQSKSFQTLNIIPNISKISELSFLSPFLRQLRWEHGPAVRHYDASSPARARSVAAINFLLTAHDERRLWEEEPHLDTEELGGTFADQLGFEHEASTVGLRTLAASIEATEDLTLNAAEFGLFTHHDFSSHISDGCGHAKEL